MNEQEIKTINRRYRLSYLIIPLPMIAGLILAGYAYTTKDQRTDCFCAVASESQDYAKHLIEQKKFQQLKPMTVAQCRVLDDEIDGQTDGVGRSDGRVRWFVCTGMSCGPGWENILAE